MPQALRAKRGQGLHTEPASSAAHTPGFCSAQGVAPSSLPHCSQSHRVRLQTLCHRASKPSPGLRVGTESLLTGWIIMRAHHYWALMHFLKHFTCMVSLSLPQDPMRQMLLSQFAPCYTAHQCGSREGDKLPAVWLERSFFTAL